MIIPCTVWATAAMNWEAVGAIGTCVTGGAAAYIAILTYRATKARAAKEDREREALAQAAGAYFLRPFSAHANRLSVLQVLIKQATELQSSRTLEALAHGINEVTGHGLPPLDPILQGVGAMSPDLSEATLTVYGDFHETMASICRLPPKLLGAAVLIDSDPNEAKSARIHVAHLERKIQATIVGVEAVIAKLREAYPLLR